MDITTYRDIEKKNTNVCHISSLLYGLTIFFLSIERVYTIKIYNLISSAKCGHDGVCKEIMKDWNMKIKNEGYPEK